MSDIFDNKWHSSDPTGSKSLVARFVITFFAVGARLLCKFLRGRRTLSLDDCFIVLALVTSTIGEALVFWAVSKGGTGSFIPLLLEQGNYQGLQDFLLGTFIGALTDYVTLTFVRLSILAFYRHFFGLSRAFNIAALVIAATSTLWTIACIFAYVFMCEPVDYLWKPLEKGVCHDYMLFFLITEIIETIMDFSILMLPIPALSRLHLEMRTRLLIIAIFMLGIFTVVTNCLRIKFVYQPHSYYVNINQLTLWTSIHITAAIVCACLPLLKPFPLKVIEVINVATTYALSLISGSLNRSRNGHSQTLTPHGSHNTPAQNDGDTSSLENLFHMRNYTGAPGDEVVYKLDHQGDTVTYQAAVGSGTKEQSNQGRGMAINVQHEFEVK